MEEVKGYDTETEKEGAGSSEVTIYDGKSNGAAAAADHKPVIVHGKLRRLTGPARRSSKANWTEEEDDILRDAVQKYEGKCWKKIAERLPGRTDVQCLHRWQKVLKPDLVKGPWSKEEDSLLIELVGNLSEKKWSEIAEQLPGRMGKQCRERWYNHLKPEINKAAWTDEEEKILINAHAVYGNKWSILAKLLPGRTENSVKNHWNCSLKKKFGNSSSHSFSRLLDDPSKTMNYACTSQTKVLGCTSLDENDSPHGTHGHSRKPRLMIRSPPPETSSKYLLTYLNSPPDKCYDGRNFIMSCSIRSRRHNDICDNLQSSSDWSYTGLCYEPVQKADLNIFLSTGRFPSTESYIRQPPRSISVPPSRSHSCDLYSIITYKLRSAAMNYDNMPSIIRKRATQNLHKGVPTPHKVFSPKYHKLENFAAIKSVGKCLEPEFSEDARD